MEIDLFVELLGERPPIVVLCPLACFFVHLESEFPTITVISRHEPARRTVREYCTDFTQCSAIKFI